jgi:hypothetical protein
MTLQNVYVLVIYTQVFTSGSRSVFTIVTIKSE